MKFTEEQKVFAKVRGYPPWPARIMDIIGDKPQNIRYNVYFYGTKESALLKYSKIFPFLEMLNKFGGHKKRKQFNKAMSEIMSDLTPAEKSKLETLKATSSRSKSNKESSEPQNITGEVNTKEFKIGKETIIIPDDTKRLNFYRIEGELLEIDLGIRKALAIRNPNLPNCIKLLDDLYNLEIEPIMLKKHPDIVYTLMKSRRYHISRKIKDINDIQSTNIRNKSEEILSKFENMFPEPKGSSFISNFERILDEFQLQYGHASIQEYADLIS